MEWEWERKLGWVRWGGHHNVVASDVSSPALHHALSTWSMSHAPVATSCAGWPRGVIGHDDIIIFIPGSRDDTLELPHRGQDGDCGSGPHAQDLLALGGVCHPFLDRHAIEIRFGFRTRKGGARG